MRAWRVHQPGPPESLHFEDLPDPQPREGWVLVGVRAFGLNRSEVHTRRGYAGKAVVFPRVIGIECTGEVLDNGGDDRLPVGTRVGAAMGGLGRAYDGGYAERALIPRAQVHPVETDLPWEVFGALPETFFTAWISLFDQMNVAPGQTILIRAGTSSVGMAAITLLRDLGCTVLATTRNPDKARFLTEAGADHVIIGGQTVEAPLRALAPDGVDGVLDLVGTPETITESGRLVKPPGAVCASGVLGGEWGFDVPPLPEGVRYAFGDSDLVRGPAWTRVLQQVADGVAAGRLRSGLDRVFDFSEVVEAHRTMEENRAAGKLVVVVPAG